MRLFKKLTKKTIIVILTLVIIGIPLLYLTLLNSPTAKAAWYNDNWAYRKAVNIATHDASQNNVYINLTGADDIDTSDTGRFQTDCGDLRFTDATGNLLQYYIVSGCSSADTVVHVNFTTMPAGAQTVYYYYGNPTVQNGGNTADFTTEASNYTFTTIGSEEKTPGPIAYWKFDDGTGTTTQDATTNNLDGTLSGPTWQTEDQCITGKCLLFDGTNDYVYAADNAILDNASSALTVGAWIKPNSYDASNWDIIATKWKDGAPASYSWHFSLHQGKLSIFISSDGTSAGSELAVDSSVIETNKWSYVVFTVDTATDQVKLYKNGVQVGSTGSYTASSIPNSSAQLRIGTKEGAGEGSFPFPGFIDDVKIYPYARSAAQIKTDYDSRGSVKGTSAALSASTSNNTALSNGLVGYWKMDQSSWSGIASEVVDSSGNGNHGTAANSATTGIGKFGNGGVFGSSNKYVNGGSGSTTNLSSGIFTLSAWIYPTTTQTGYSFIFTKEATNSYGFGFDTNGYPYLAINDGSWTEYPAQNSNLSINTWHHFVAIRSSDNTLKFYIDGVQAANTYSGVKVPQSSSANLGIGGKVAGTYSFNGTIDEARIYNRALSPADVSALYNFAPGPVGYWKFDEKTGTAANDSSGNGNEATLTNTPTWTTGKYGAGINFAGSNQHITRADDADFDFADDADVTVETWIKHATTSTQEIILSKYQEAGYKIIMESDGDLTCALDYDNTWTPTDSATSTAATYDDNNWHHVSCVKIGASSLNLYIDGVLIATDSSLTATNTLTNSDPLYIGIDADGTSNDWIGQIDDVKIYNYARTAKQIVEDMNAGHPAIGSPVGSAVGHWKFDEGVDNICSGGTNDACNSGSQGSTLDGSNSGLASPATATSGWTNSGKFGKALIFDGSNDYVETNYVLPTTNLTYTFWAKSSASGLTNRPFGNADSTAGLSGSGVIWGYNGATHLYVVNRQGANVGTYDIDAVAPGISSGWHHVAVTINSTNGATLYWDGVIIGTNTLTTSITSSLTTRIGRHGNGSDAFNGTIDEVKIYNYALTADEVKIDMNRGQAQVLGSLSDNSSYQPNAANQEYCVPGDTSTSCAAPVGEWKFDEKTGTSARDTSGNAFTGTLTSSPTWTQGKIGSGVAVSSTNSSYVTMGNINKTMYTLSFWFKPTSTVDASNAGGLNNLVVFIDGSGHNADVWLQGGPATGACTNEVMTIVSTLANTRTCSSSITSISPTWNHLVLVWNSTSSRYDMYLNGQLQTVTPGTATHVGLTTISALKIAQRGATPEFADSWGDFAIDQLRIYDYARSAAQIAWDYNRGAPVGHWKFDECQGDRANDSSGNSFTGTITPGGAPNTAVGTCTVSAATMWNGGAAGKYNASLDFDGTDDYVTVADTANLRFDASTVDFSLFAWIKRTTTGTEYILSKEDADNDGYRLMFNSSNQVLCSEDATDVTSTSTITDTNWHLVGCTIDRDGNGQVYIDGRADGSTTAMGTDAMATTTALTIGTRSYTATSYITGQIDDVRIYNYALTATQVKTLMNQNAAVRFGPVTGSP